MPEGSRTSISGRLAEAVAREDTARGYEVAKGQYLIVEDQEIDAVQTESTRGQLRSIDSVPHGEIDDLVY